MNFDREAWMPIHLNKDYYLLDGQHRLELARQMGLSFIDIIIQDTELLEEKVYHG
jgi:ParB-like chromosome segregation protein Spo0J